jgi:hypothetical protein
MLSSGRIGLAEVFLAAGGGGTLFSIACSGVSVMAEVSQSMADSGGLSSRERGF